MSHFTLRIGEFLHLDVLGSRHHGIWTTGEKPRAVGLAAASKPCQVDELAFFGLCNDSRSEDPHRELDRLGMIQRTGQVLYGVDAPERVLL